MSFAEKMEVARFVLECAKVAFGYSVTVPLLILILCLLFRARIGQAIDALLEVTFPGGSAKFDRRQLVEYTEDAQRTAGAATRRTLEQLPPGRAKEVEALASFFGLAARLLPLVPKADRHRFIEETTATLPQEFSTFRVALFGLADEAPEVRPRNARDVILTLGPGEFRIRGREATLRSGRHDDPEGRR